MAPVESNKEIVRRFVKAGNERDYGALEELLAPDFVRRCQATPDVRVRSREDFRRFLAQDAAVFPDNRVTLETLVAEGDLVAFWATYSGTQEGVMGPYPPSGRRMTLEFGGVFRIREERIVELTLTWDNLAALVQLGHLSPPEASPEREGPEPRQGS